MMYTREHLLESDLALYAGGDLPWWKRRRAERHVRQCSVCQEAAAEYSELRALDCPVPQLNWAQLESEMKANIRLGLAAGECVSLPATTRSMVSGTRLAVAGALLTVLVAVGAWVNRPGVLRGVARHAVSGTLLEASGGGIEVSGTQQTLRILNPATRNVTYTVGAQGELGARSLDPTTGNVAITHVYGE